MYITVLLLDTERTPKRTKESAGEYAEPNTTATPQVDTPDVGSRGGFAKVDNRFGYEKWT